MNPFDFQIRTRIVFGPGTLDRLGELVKEYGGSRVMLVSDKGIVAAGYDERAVRLIEAAGAPVFLFDEVGENPTTKHVDLAARFAAEHQVDFIVGLGGGSSMDCAKGANFVFTNGGRMQDYWGTDKATKPMLPMIAIPTTSGTGSEVQSYALITDEQTHIKMACGDKKAACKVAILDPALTISQPPRVAAITGIDAISHAVESYVTTRRSPISRFFALEAWRMLASNFPKIFADPNDLEARSCMLLGASFAGVAIENSMLGAAHSCANPLTARFDITHGIAIGLMLPHVVRFNGAAADALYSELIHALPQLHRNGGSPSHSVAAMIEELREDAGLPSRLSDCGVVRGAIPQLANEATAQWTAQFNPRPLSGSDFVQLYEAAW